MSSAGGGHDGGQGGVNICPLPDGRNIPAGQEFDYIQNGVAVRCTCPTHSVVGKDIDVPCKEGWSIQFCRTSISKIIIWNAKF